MHLQTRSSLAPAPHTASRASTQKCVSTSIKAPTASLATATTFNQATRIRSPQNSDHPQHSQSPLASKISQGSSCINQTIKILKNNTHSPNTQASNSNEVLTNETWAVRKCKEVGMRSLDFRSKCCGWPLAQCGEALTKVWANSISRSQKQSLFRSA